MSLNYRHAGEQDENHTTTVDPARDLVVFPLIHTVDSSRSSSNQAPASAASAASGIQGGDCVGGWFVGLDHSSS